MGLGSSAADLSADADGAPSMGLKNELTEDCWGPLFPPINGRAEVNKSPEGDWATNPPTSSTVKGLHKTFFLFSAQPLMVVASTTQGHENWW